MKLWTDLETAVKALAVPTIIAAGTTYEPPVGQTLFVRRIAVAGRMKIDAGALVIGMAS